jgi:hypothetical protein
MIKSPRIEKMLAPYGYEVAMKFFNSFDIGYFIDQHHHVKKGSCIRLRVDGKEYAFDDPNTFSFQIEKENPYHSPTCYIVTFRNTEDELINKFSRFIKMKAFL